jgi:hypothetical protein
MLDTELAWLNSELAGLVQDPRFELAAVFPLLLSLVSMVEHAKCLAKGQEQRMVIPSVESRASLRSAFKPDAAAQRFAAAHNDGHGHSHGGAPCSGHGHGGHDTASGRADGSSNSHHGVHSTAVGVEHVPEAASAATSHGHSHGGVPCNGHGHGPGRAGHAHGLPADAGAPPSRRDLCTDHPWGSQMRALFSVMPSPSELQVAVYYTPAHFQAIKGPSI